MHYEVMKYYDLPRHGIFTKGVRLGRSFFFLTFDFLWSLKDRGTGDPSRGALSLPQPLLRRNSSLLALEHCNPLPRL